MKFRSDVIIPIIIFIGFGFFIGGIICSTPDRIVKENSEYIWVMEHTLYDLDSCIYKYHKDITYDGVVTEETMHFVGVAGKGGHFIYERVITYNNKEYKTSEFPWNCKVGQKVKVVEKFYPHHNINIIW
jgi:hypothetical protein